MLEARELMLQPQRERRYSPELPGGREQPKRGLQAKTRKLLLLMVIACFVLGLAALIQYSRTVGASREIYRTENRIEQIREGNQALEQEIARLSSVARIERIAREEIEMSRPESSQMYLLSRETGGEEKERSAGED